MNILVTGCNGFIGKNMIAYITSQTDWKVDGWDWTEDKTEWPKLSKYDWVIHLDDVLETTKDEDIFKNSLEFSKWLFNECQHHGVNLQYASSSEVYGYTRNYSEYAECNPQTPYGSYKFLFDDWVFRQQQKTFVQGFRYFSVYGKWMHLSRESANLMCKLRQQAKETRYIEVCENAENMKHDWVWVGDVCRLQLDFINKVKGSGIWNVGSGLSHSILDIAEEIAEQEGAEIRIVPTLNPLKYNVCADLSHLKETIGGRKWLNVYEWLDTE
jgi:nucleoside-diphosphate-sugar epimerase